MNKSIICIIKFYGDAINAKLPGTFVVNYVGVYLKKSTY